MTTAIQPHIPSSMMVSADLSQQTNYFKELLPHANDLDDQPLKTNNLRDKSLKINYLTVLTSLIAEFLRLSTEISEKEKEKTENLKKQYLQAAGSIATNITQKSLYEIAFTTAIVATTLLRSLTDSKIDQGAIDLLSKEILPQVKGYFSASSDATARRLEAKQMLLGNEHQAKAQKAASDSGKQEYLSTLRDALASSSTR